MSIWNAEGFGAWLERVIAYPDGPEIFFEIEEAP